MYLSDLNIMRNFVDRNSRSKVRFRIEWVNKWLLADRSTFAMLSTYKKIRCKTSMWRSNLDK